MRRWSRFGACVALAGILGMANSAAAQAAPSIGHGGFLRDSAGEPIDGEVDITYALFAASTGGEVLWTESHTIGVDKGVFSTVLGEQEAFGPSVFQTYPLYLEVTVRGETLSPRSQLLAQPYALNALGDITPHSVSVAGVTVIDSEGAWVGPASGLQGAPGEAGPAGPQGAPGEAGPAGAQGSTGALGPVGPQGSPGAAGPAGPQGSPGAAGPAGPQGSPGALGPQGPQGLPGTPGSTGFQGQVGPQGEPGSTGERGSAGESVVFSSAALENCPAGGVGLTLGNSTQYVCDGADGKQPFEQNGADVYYAQGRVGIGTQSPMGALDVVSTGEVTLDAQFVQPPHGVCDSPGSCYQSFTALTSGQVSRIRVPTCFGGGNIQLFDGDCATNKACDGSSDLLGTSDTANSNDCVLSAGPNTDYDFSTPVPVSAGARYTLRVNGTTAYVVHTDAYAGGATYHPTLNEGIEGDLPFEVYVKPHSQVVISDFVYFGSPEQDGAWRMGVQAGGFVIQHRVAASWVTQQTL